MDTDAPVLIRNVSQFLTASVLHSLGQKRKHFSLAYHPVFQSLTPLLTRSQHADMSTVTLKWLHSCEGKLWCVGGQAEPLCEVDYSLELIKLY